MAIRLLLECARDHPDTQFILLSPQDVTSIQHADEAVRETSAQMKQDIPNPEHFTKIVEMRPARIGNASRVTL